MQNLQDDLNVALAQDETLLDEQGELIKSEVNARATRLDPALLKLLLGAESLRDHFFAEVGGTMVFDKVRFAEFVSNKAFLPDSYTAFRNRIGLTDGSGHYLKDSGDVVLAWPYKDCVLEGGMTKEDAKRDEVFWNTTLAPDDITRLFEAKALTGFERWDVEAVKKGEAKPVEAIDPEKDNLLIKGNNLLVLRSLLKRYAGKVDCVYIDPPYNPPSDSNTFLYNNRFNHSSWLTFMKNRIDQAKLLMKPLGSMIVAIDENELFPLGFLLREIFPNHEIHCVSIIHNPRGVQGTNFSYINEWALFVIPKAINTIGDRQIDEEDVDWANFRNWGGESERSDAKTCFYPVLVKDGQVVGFGNVADDDEHPEQTLEVDGTYHVYPIDTKGVERKWRYNRKSAEEIKHLLRAVWRKGHYEIELGKDFGMMRTVWYDSRYDANSYGTQLLKDLVPNCEFKFPKALWTVHDCLKAVVGEKTDALVLDFFAGSGTTGQAVVELNKTDGGNRRWIIAEQLEYVRSCTRQRMIEVFRRDKPKASFVYCELAEWNEALARRLRDADDEAELERVVADVRANGYWRYKVDQNKWDWDAFAKLPFDDRKQLLIDSIDANHLYVNYGDIADAAYSIDEADIAVNKAFYEGGE